jgi:hypothetical protein
MNETSSPGSPGLSARSFTLSLQFLSGARVKAGGLVAKSTMVIKSLPFTQKCPEGGVFCLNDQIFRHLLTKSFLKRISY